jgi:hypothetical protein
MESQVAKSLETIKNLGLVPGFNTVLEFSPQETPSIPDMTPLSINLAEFDNLLKNPREDENE